MSVYETDKYPFLAKSAGLFAERVRRNRPVLGVSLGAQLLARSLGATVLPGLTMEIGFGSVPLTAEGKQDPVLGPAGRAEIPKLVRRSQRVRSSSIYFREQR